MGPVMNEDGTADNDAVVVNMYDGFSIIGDNGSQGIATNASNGAHAGFTFNMYGGIIAMDGTDGCGMYLPAYGEVNVYDGHVKAEQGIRIAAGELNITGGTKMCIRDRVWKTLSAAILAGKIYSGFPMALFKEKRNEIF